MTSEKRRWVWVVIVAVVAAVVWWLVPQGTSPSQEPAAEPQAKERPDEPMPAIGAQRANDDAESAGGPPTAEPLPRDEVVLPPTSAASALDGGVRGDAPGEASGGRDAMLRTVLDRLRQDLSAAEKANDEDEAARLRVRIERLETRRQELAAP